MNNADTDVQTNKEVYFPISFASSVYEVILYDCMNANPGTLQYMSKILWIITGSTAKMEILFEKGIGEFRYLAIGK